MSVNRIKINSATITGDTISINLPIGQRFSEVGQSDAIENKFVKEEVKKTINPIIDYERVRFSPVNPLNDKMKSVTFEIHPILGDTYSENGFVANDFYYRRNNIKMSFLSLDYFDSNRPTKADFLFNSDTYVQFKEPNPDTAVNSGIKFKLDDPILTPEGFSEGFYTYYDKSAVSEGNDIDLFIIFRFNNAKTGESNKMMTTSNILTSGYEVIQYLYTKVTLRKTGDEYVYFFEDTPNVVYTSDSVTVKLYETEITL